MSEVGDATKDAVFTRGSIITSYAHIEYLLADICLQAWKTSEYAQLASSFPYKTESRIKAVRQLLNFGGSLDKYRGDLQPVLDELLDFEELRHFIAHGVMIVRAAQPTDAPIEYRLFQTTKEGVKLGTINTTSAEQDEIALKLTSLLHRMLTAFNQIYSEVGFELER